MASYPLYVNRVNCSGGSFCADGTPASSLQCLSGYSCREGSTAPLKCAAFALCPAGTDQPNQLWPCIVIMLLFFVFVMWGKMLKGASRVDSMIEDERSSMMSLRLRGPLRRWLAKARFSLSKVSRLAARSRAGEGAGGVVGGLAVSFQGVTTSLRSTGAIILDNCTGSFAGGQLHAILGASGCGKSSLLNELFGRGDPNVRQLHAGSLIGPASLRLLRSDAALVPQEDALPAGSTVHETLCMASLLRGGGGAAPQQRQGRGGGCASTFSHLLCCGAQRPSGHPATRGDAVEGIERLLGLYAERHSLVGDADARGISGGQRKRVSIGCELVGYPAVLASDEPTSGLDSSTAQRLVEAFRALADGPTKTNVIIALHQPRSSIFELFDTVTLINRGAIVFQGEREQAVAHFTSRGYAKPEGINDPDYLLDVLSGTITQQGGGGGGGRTVPELGATLKPSGFSGGSGRNMEERKSIGISSVGSLNFSGEGCSVSSSYASSRGGFLTLPVIPDTRKASFFTVNIQEEEGGRQQLSATTSASHPLQSEEGSLVTCIAAHSSLFPPAARLPGQEEETVRVHSTSANTNKAPLDTCCPATPPCCGRPLTARLSHCFGSILRLLDSSLLRSLSSFLSVIALCYACAIFQQGEGDATANASAAGAPTDQARAILEATYPKVPTGFGSSGGALYSSLFPSIIIKLLMVVFLLEALARIGLKAAALCSCTACPVRTGSGQREMGGASHASIQQPQSCCAPPFSSALGVRGGFGGALCLFLPFSLDASIAILSLSFLSASAGSSGAPPFLRLFLFVVGTTSLRLLQSLAPSSSSKGPPLLGMQRGGSWAFLAHHVCSNKLVKCFSVCPKQPPFRPLRTTAVVESVLGAPSPPTKDITGLPPGYHAPPPASLLTQLYVFLLQAFRDHIFNAATNLSYCLILTILGGLVGYAFNNGPGDQPLFQMKLLICELCLALVAGAGGMSTFAANQALYYRDRAGGSSSAWTYFLAKVAAHTFFSLAQPAFFLVAYLPLSHSYARWTDLYASFWCLQFAASGVGMIFGVLFERDRGAVPMVCSIMLCAIANAFLPRLSFFETALGLGKMGTNIALGWSFMRWTAEALLMSEMKGFPKGWNRVAVVIKADQGFDESHIYFPCLLITLTLGFIARAIAYLSLLFKKRHLQARGGGSLC